MLARSFARIHWQNLVNFGVLPLCFVRDGDYERIRKGERILLEGLRAGLRAGGELRLEIGAGGQTIPVRHDLWARHVEVLLAGGLIPWIRARRGDSAQKK